MKKQFFLLAILFLFFLLFHKSILPVKCVCAVCGHNQLTEKVHNGGFLVTSFETTDSTNINIGATGGGAGAGKVSFGTAKLQKLLDPATNPTIMMDLSIW